MLNSLINSDSVEASVASHNEIVQKRTSFKIIATLFLIANIFDMGGAIGIKYLSYVPVIIYIIIILPRLKLKRADVLWGLFLFIVWPMWSMYFGIINGGDLGSALQEITPFWCGILFFVFIQRSEYKFPLRLFYKCMFLLAIVIIILFILFLLIPNIINFPIFNILQKPGMGYFGIRVMGRNLIPGIYFGSTLFLVPTFVYYLFIGKNIKAVITFIAITLALSKSGIFLCLIFFLIFMISSNKLKIKNSLVVVISIVLILLSLFNAYPGWVEEIQTTLTGDSGTAIVRIEHIKSFITLIEQNPEFLITGQGTGTVMYTTAWDEMVTNIELDHLNTIRKFGLIWFSFFSGLALYIFKQLLRRNDPELFAMGLALISGFIAAGTNPVLITPIFMMILFGSYYAIGGHK